MLDRATARVALLRKAGWEQANAAFLAGDASDRSYDRLTRPDGQTAVLMDAPPGKGDDSADFLAVARHLHDLGLSAPREIASDLAHGFLLLEDFGDRVFATALAADMSLEPLLYATAIDATVVIQAKPPMAGLPALSAAEWAAAAGLVLETYRGLGNPPPCDPAAFLAGLTELIDKAANGPSVMILRDFHAENLIWLPDRQGAARAGLLDFQLAQMGHPVYDVVSLLQDARRDVGPDTERQTIVHYCDAIGMSDTDFGFAAAVWGAQRALRILGVFARLARQSGKTGYVRLIPRVWAHLQRSLGHPALERFSRTCSRLLPPPDEALLARLVKAGGR
jgi:N-acetylmuramate 1-kinase